MKILTLLLMTCLLNLECIANDYPIKQNGLICWDAASARIMLSELQLSNYNNSSNNFYGNTKDLKVYPKALADVQLEDLTTI